MRRQRVGLWLVGAFGGVGTTITLGLSAMAQRPFGPHRAGERAADVPGPAAGGAGRVHRGRPRYPRDVVPGIGRGIPAELRRLPGRVDRGVRRGTRRGLERGSGRGRASAPGRPSPGWGTGERSSHPGRRGRPSTSVAADLAAFVESESIGHMIVLNVASTEPPFQPGPVHRHWDTLNAAMADGGSALLPASAVYAAAALRVRLHLHQLHAQRRRVAARPARARRVQRGPVCRQGRQDRRDPDEDRARADVRRCATCRS